jgi:hypothetical protein
VKVPDYIAALEGVHFVEHPDNRPVCRVPAPQAIPK